MEVKDLKEMREAVKYAPVMHVLMKEVHKLIPKTEGMPIEDLAEIFWDKVFQDWDLDNKEYQDTGCRVKSFSLIIWTERFQGGDDYSLFEYRYMDTVIEILTPIYPDIMFHKNTRLMIPGVN